MLFLIFAIITLVSTASYLKHIEIGFAENSDALKSLAEIENGEEKSYCQRLTFTEKLLAYLFIFAINFLCFSMGKHGLPAISIIIQSVIIVAVLVFLIVIAGTEYQLKAVSYLAISFAYTLHTSIAYANNGHYDHNLGRFITILLSFLLPMILVIIAYFIGKIRLKAKEE